MKILFKIPIFLLLAANILAQSPNTPPILFSSRFQITNAVNGTGDTIVISGYTDDCTTRFSNSDIAIGDSLYVLEGTDLLIFGVVTTRTISLGIATFKVRDFNGAGLLPSNGQAAIFRPTTDYDFPGYVCGLNDGLQQYISDRFRQNLDAALAAGSTDSTIYATVYSRDTAAAAIRGEIGVLSDSIPVHRTDINNLQTLSGRPDGSTHLGTMGQGTQFPDNLSIKTFADSTDAKLGRTQPSIATLPAGFAITSAEKIASSDSSYTFQKQVNQLRDSTIFSAPTYSDIVKISTTLKAGDRIKVKNTGVEYIVQADSVTGYATDGIAVIDVGANYAVMQYGKGYLLSAFNVKPSNDSITNRQNLQRALNYAGVTNNPNIYMDVAGTIKMLLTTTINFLHPGKEFNLIGQDTSKTIFEIYPRTGLSASLYVFTFTQASNSHQLGTVSFNDVKISLPTSVNSPANVDVCAFRMLGGGMGLNLKRVSVRGHGVKTIYFGGANTDDNLTSRVLNIEDSHIEADTTTGAESVCVQYTGGRWENYLYAKGTKFTGGSANGHQLYVQPWLNWLLEDCTFGVATSVGSAQLFQANQTLGGTWPTWVPTKFQIFRNCTFVAGSYTGINLDKNYFPGLLVEGCNFYNTGQHLDVKNYATVSNCYFNGGTGIRFNTDAGEGNIVVTNCRFKNDFGVSVTGGTAIKSIRVNINNSTFLDCGSNIIQSTLSGTDTTNVIFNISNCSFRNTISPTQNLYIGADVANTTAKVFFNNCTFDGEMFLLRGSYNWEVYVNGGAWTRGNGDFYTNLTSSGITTTKFEVRNLKILGGYPLNVVEDRATYTDKTFSRAKWYFPHFEWPQNVIIPSDNIPDSLNIGHGIYNIADPSSRDSITSIHMTYENVGSGYATPSSDRYYGKYIAGEIRLRAKDPFKLGTSGNINISTPFQVEMGQEAILKWNWDSLYWDCLSCYEGNPTMGGDLSGTASSAQIVPGAVGTNELASGVGGIYKGDGTTPADVDVTVTDSLNFDAGTLQVHGNTDRVSIGSSATDPSAQLSVRKDGIGTAQNNANGIVLRNSTAAAAGAQQVSPPVRWQGQGWKTNATAASQSVDFIADVLPNQAAAAPTATWQLKASINAGAYSELFRARSDGTFLLGSNANRPQLMTATGIATPAIDGSSLYFSVDQVSSSVPFAYYFNATDRGYTSGTFNSVTIKNGFTPASGNAVVNTLSIQPTVNQTSGGTGITRGVHVVTTLTNPADFRAIETDNSLGVQIYAGGTAKSYFGGNVGFGTATPDKKVGIGDGTDEFAVSVDSDKLTFWNDAGTPGIIATMDSTGVVDAVVGYRINGGATSGNYLRGNGTNFVSSAIQAGDISSLAWMVGGNTATDPTLGTNNTEPIHFETAGTRRFSIPSSGIANTPASTKALILSSNDSLQYKILQSDGFGSTVTQSGSDTLLNSALNYGHFQRVGDIVTFTVRIEIALVNTGAANTVYFDPPIASNFLTASTDVIGTASMDSQGLSSANTAHQRCLLFASDSDDKIGISFDPVASLSYPENRMYISASGSYIIQ